MDGLNLHLILPETMKCHNVFHASKVKPYIDPIIDFPERSRVHLEPSPELINEDGEYFEVERILDSRKHYGKQQYLVRWKGYDSSRDRWLPISMCPDAIQEYLNTQGAAPRRSRRKTKATIASITCARGAVMLQQEIGLSTNG